MRHRKFIHRPLEIRYKNSLSKNWEVVKGFRNIQKALKWVNSSQLPTLSDEILLRDSLSDQEFLYSCDQNCFREIV